MSIFGGDKANEFKIYHPKDNQGGNVESKPTYRSD